MNTRDFILVGAGALVGYLLVGVMNRDKGVTAMEVETGSLPDSSAQTLPPATTGSSTAGTTQIKEPEVVETIVDPRVSYCEDNWSRYAMTMRFGSEEQMLETKKNFIEQCLATRVQ